MKWINLKKAFFVKIALIFSFLAIFLSLQPNLTLSSATYTLIPGGETIGIRLDTGVYVAGKYKWKPKAASKPLENCNIEAGDRILSFNGKPVRSNQDLVNYLKITMKLPQN